MASLPPRPASQRRPRDQDPSSSDSHQAQLSRADSEAFSTTSEDSQTLLLNRRRSTQPFSNTTPQNRQTSAQQSVPEVDVEPRKCWICFNDETEDTPLSSEWRSPCPCVLVAHEKCILDWIADMEAPNTRRRAGGSGKVLCPQCRSEIHLLRPRSVVVDAVRALERLTGLMLVPGVFVVLGSAAYSTATMLGTHAIYEIFGMEDGLQILQPLYDPPDVTEASPVIRLLNHLRQHWRLDIGLPLIPSILIASRITIADSFLPIIPMIFFASSSSPDEMLNVGHWPPSAALTVALLPYIRAGYNAYYERFWLPREQRWLKEIQPRAGDTPEEGQGANEDNNPNHIHEIFEDENGVMDIEVDLDFEVFRDWNNGGPADNHNAAEAPPVPIARGPAAPLNAPPLDADDAAPAPNVPAQPRNRNNRRMERALNFNTTSLADTVLGALIFPSIAAAVGEALRLALPRSWVTPPVSGKPTGLLQARWGRSIVGGCLFVGVKDAVMLYVRWKMAQNHRKRRVLDYDKVKKRVIRP